MIKASTPTIPEGAYWTFGTWDWTEQRRRKPVWCSKWQWWTCHGFDYFAVYAVSYIFFPGLFFIILSYFGSFMVVWGFGVGVFSWWGLGPVVWGLLGFLGWGSLYKHKRITLGKKWCCTDSSQAPIIMHRLEWCYWHLSVHWQWAHDSWSSLNGISEWMDIWEWTAFMSSIPIWER